MEDTRWKRQEKSLGGNEWYLNGKNRKPVRKKTKYDKQDTEWLTGKGENNKKK